MKFHVDAVGGKTRVNNSIETVRFPYIEEEYLRNSKVSHMFKL